MDDLACIPITQLDKSDLRRVWSLKEDGLHKFQGEIAGSDGNGSFCSCSFVRDEAHLPYRRSLTVSSSGSLTAAALPARARSEITKPQRRVPYLTKLRHRRLPPRVYCHRDTGYSFLMRYSTIFPFTSYAGSYSDEKAEACCV